MIEDILRTLQDWYDEQTDGPHRPNFLSKLAVIELCGWLEVEQDQIIMDISSNCLNDANWMNKNVISNTHGFDYVRHFRPMLTSVLGEHSTRKLENQITSKYPADIELLKSNTGDLWSKRCKFAHEDLISNITKQVYFFAPSWCLSRFNVLSKILCHFKQEALILVQSL